MWRRWLWTVVSLTLACMVVRAQAISSGSTGVDGALNLITPGTIVFDPVALGLDADGDNVFNFTTINIGAGVTVKLTNAKLKGKSVIWLASGAVTISGIIDLNGDSGSLPGDASSARHLAEPGPGGFDGGLAGDVSGAIPPTSGAGPGGGLCCVQLGGGGGGHAFAGGGSASGGGKAYDNAALVPLRGGSGGGGAFGNGLVSGGGGGAGGGALRIFSSASVVINGTIAANGGVGGFSTQSPFGNSGGGGSAGGIHLIAPSISGSGTLSAQGGVAPQTNSGSVGRIRLEAFQQNFTGTSNPIASQGTPYAVPLPTNVPSLRIVTVNGIAVPLNPTGASNLADISINTASPIPLTLEARNIPVGTIVKINVISDAAGDSVVNSSPLGGTLTLSTATATVQPGPGFTRLSIRATW